MVRVRCRGAGVKPTVAALKGLIVATDVCDCSAMLFIPLDWLDGSGEVDSSSSSSIVACAVRGGCGVGCANRGRAVELITSMRNERRREYGVAKSLSSCSDATAGVEGRPGAKKRGRGRGGNAGVGVNMTDGPGDDGATETVGRDSVSARLDETKTGVAEGEWGWGWGWGVGSSEEKVGPGSSASSSESATLLACAVSSGVVRSSLPSSACSKSCSKSRDSEVSLGSGKSPGEVGSPSESWGGGGRESMLSDGASFACVGPGDLLE